MLIRAIAKLRQQGMPIALICGGDGPERETLDTLTSELGVSQNVRFVGAISEQEKPMIYSAADIFAMPSITVGQMIEGFGIVFIEAAAAGLPTICGRTGGQREAILEGISGFSVDGTVLDDVTEKIRQLAISPELRRQFGDVGQTLAEQHDWSVLVQKVQSEVEQRKV
jgi:phosphatidylinositol alpha-1,6-mannosyltransferase